MSREIEMRVLPTFMEEECAIVFSFHFIKDQIKIGEVIILTCMEKFKKKPLTIAYCQEFSILEKYKNTSMRMLMNFLKIIGINRFTIAKNKKLT